MTYYDMDDPSGLAPTKKVPILSQVKCLTQEQSEYATKLNDVIVKQQHWCLLVYGKIGTGKTYLAQVAIRTFNGRRFDGGVYTTMARIQAEIMADSKSASDAFKRLSATPALVIDELCDDWTPYLKKTIQSILVERHERELSTVLIGNLDDERVENMFDARVLDRAKEGLVQVMRGSSLRRPANG